jgi:hypothetical protein
MKGRTLSGQSKMKMGGVTKMQVGGVLSPQRGASIAAANTKARLAARAANPPAGPVRPQPKRSGALSPERGASIAAANTRARLAARANANAPKPPVPPGMMKVGGMTKKRMGGKC